MSTNYPNYYGTGRDITRLGTFRTILTLEIDEPRKPKRGLSKQSNDANSRFLIPSPISRSSKISPQPAPTRTINHQIVLLYGQYHALRQERRRRQYSDIFRRPYIR